MLMKVSDLDGRALNWAVLRSTQGEPRIWDGGQRYFFVNAYVCRPGADAYYLADESKPSTNWNDGGPLIPKYEVYLFPDTDGYVAKIHAVFEDHPDIEVTMHGVTPLQATCLCIVKYFNRCSDEIEVPEEFCEVAA